MAELICEFDTVKKAGEKLIEASGDYDKAINTFSTGIDSDLAGWSGNSKNVFNGQKEAQVVASQAASAQTKAVGEYIKGCAEAIESLDEELASLSI